MSPDHSSARGGLMAILGSVCWGLSGSMGQFLFTHEGMDSRWLVPIRLFGAGVILLLYSLLRYGPSMTVRPWTTVRDAVDLLIYGLLGVSACQFFYFLTIQLSSAGTATILQDLSPIMVLLVLCIQEKRPPNGREVLSIAMALIGVLLITTHGDFSSLSVSFRVFFTGLLCAVCVTVYTVYPGRLLSVFPVPLLQGWSFLLGGSAFFLLFHPWTYGYVPTPIGYFGIAFVILVGNVLAFVLFMTGVHLAGPEKSNLYSFAEPLTAALVSTVFLGSPFTLSDFIGFLLVFGMLLLLARQPRREVQP